MSRLKAIWYTLVWLKEMVKFQFHYLLVWEPQTRGRLSPEEFNELQARISSSPMRFEYARIEQLKERAREAWIGK